MKTKFFKTACFLLGMLFINVSTASASIGEKFNKFVGSEFSDFKSLYIIGGVILTSFVLYFVVNHFQKEEVRKPVYHGTHFSHHKRHHAHKVIKKTS
ncbi:MAG: hypothetical protein HYX39_00735 [Bacteroidetes bacterium]|nr:hypothetical protein [Bacteroidota bacterium]